MPAGISRNQGFFNCLDVIAKEGTVLNPVYPATNASQAVTLGGEITECVMLAMSQIAPEDTPATWGRHSNTLFAGMRRDRIDPRTESISEYTAHLFHACPSSGAACGYDRVDGSGSSSLGGACIRAPVEVTEWYIPYRWEAYEFKTGSAGPGEWRGGLGMHVETVNVYDRNLWQPLDCLTMSGNADGEKFNSVGLQGGEGGTTTAPWITCSGERIDYRTFDLKYLEPGDILVQDSGGGGGYGDPLDRDVEKVRWDVLNEYISVAAAHDRYVVVDPVTVSVDREAIAQLRNKLKKARTSATGRKLRN